MSEPIARRLIVIGLGLIGGSLALAAKKHGLVEQVVGVNRSADSLKFARENGVADQTFQSIEEAIKDCTEQDIILLGVPLLACLLYTSPSPRDQRGSRMPSSA